MKTLLCISPHAYSDPSSGAAISLKTLTSILREHGWRVAALCGDLFDANPHRTKTVEEILKAQGHQFVREQDLLIYCDAGVPVFCQYQKSDAKFMSHAKALLDHNPTAVLVYGGGLITRSVAKMAHDKGIPVVFWLRNGCYENPSLFINVTHTLVPSKALQKHYEAIGITTTVIPSPIDVSSVKTTPGDSLTFITATETKGVKLAADIFRKLERTNIPFVVAEGRGEFSRLGLSRDRFTVLSGTSDPKTIYSKTRVLIAPSHWYEGFLRVGAEASLNGIPVLATDRGGIPETLNGGGFLFNQTSTSDAWVELIKRLWTDQEFYDEASKRALKASQVHLKTSDLYINFFNNLDTSTVDY